MYHAAGNKPLWQNYAQPGTPDDGMIAQQMLGNTAVDYFNNYAAPGIEAAILHSKGADEAAGRALGRYQSQVYEHPIQTVLDVPIIPGLKGAGRMIKMGTQAAMDVPLVARAANAAGRVTNAIPPIRNARVFNTINKVFSGADAKFTQEMRGINSELDQLYQAVPDDVKPQLIPGAHVTDEIARAAIDHSPEAQAFLAKVNEYNERIANEAIKRGMLTPEQVERTLYEPFALAMKSEGALNQAAPMARDLTAQDIAAAKAALDRAGIQPTYFGLIYKDAIKKLPQNMRSVFANNLNKPESLSQKPGWMQPREKASFGYTADGMGTIVSPEQSLNALAVAKKRIHDGLQFFQLQHAVDDLLQNPTLAGLQPGKGMTPFDGSQFLKDAAKQAGFGAKEAEALAAGLPETARAISLPTGVTKWLKRLVQLQDSAADNLHSFMDHPIYKYGYRKPAQVFRRALLGYDVLGWPSIQFVQGGMMFGGHAFEGPHRMLSSLMALGMSLVPKYRNLVPKELLADYQKLVEVAAPEGMANRLNGVKNALNFIPDKLTYPLVNAADNHWRIAGTLYEAMKRGKGFGPKALADTIDQHYGDITQSVFNHYGDFRPTGSPYERLMNDTVMFSPWLVNANRIASTMVTQHPYKTAALSNLAQQAPSAFQDPRITPDYLIRAGAVPYGPNQKDPNNDQLVSLKPGVIPFAQPFQTAQAAANLFTPWLNPTGGDPRGLTLNPVIPFVPTQEQINPNLVPYGKGYVTRADFEEAKEQGKPVPADKIIKEFHNDPITAGMQRFFPRQTQQLLRAKEFPFVPSGGSSLIGEAAPQRVDRGKRREGVYGKDVLQNLLQYGLLYGRFAPTAAKMDKEQEEGMQKKEYVKARVRDALMNANKDDDDDKD